VTASDKLNPGLKKFRDSELADLVGALQHQIDTIKTELGMPAAEVNWTRPGQSEGTSLPRFSLMAWAETASPFDPVISESYQGLGMI
jgi:hypothetical protein